MQDFANAVATRRLMLDGAMGTLLQEADLPVGVPPELWNVQAPEKVAAAHLAYLEAGAEIVETNTFGGSPAKLGLYGLAERAVELNRAGAALARKAVGDRAWVLGSLGPSGRLLAPFGDLDPGEAAAGFQLQAAALAAGGVDAINIETMSDLIELRLAIMAALATGLPVLAEVALAPNGRTLYGSPPEAVGAFFAGFPLVAAGANCGLAPDVLAPLLPGFRRAWRGALIAQPNAGQPGNYLDPEAFAVTVAGLADLGATLLGGCCGTTPAHLAALRQELGRRPSVAPAIQPVPQPFISSRHTIRPLSALPTGPTVPVRDEEQDLQAEIEACGEAEAIILDLDPAGMSPAVLGSWLAGCWPALNVPIVFRADREEILTAAIASYPGRPGACGPNGLAAAAGRLGALWLGD